MPLRGIEHQFSQKKAKKIPPRGPTASSHGDRTHMEEHCRIQLKDRLNGCTVVHTPSQCEGGSRTDTISSARTQLLCSERIQTQREVGSVRLIGYAVVTDSIGCKHPGLEDSKVNRMWLGLRGHPHCLCLTTCTTGGFVLSGFHDCFSN